MKSLDKKYYDKAFAQHKINGFRLKFPNGNGLSTIWSYCSYSENYDLPDIQDEIERFETPLGSNTVEIMPDCSEELMKYLQEKYPDNENGPVFGHLTLAQWLEIVNILSTTPLSDNKE